MSDPKLREIDRQLEILAGREQLLRQEIEGIEKRRADLEQAKAMLRNASALLGATPTKTKAEPKKRRRPRPQPHPTEAEERRHDVEAIVREAGEIGADLVRLALAGRDRRKGVGVYRILAQLEAEGVIERLGERDGHAPIYRWLGHKPKLTIP